MRLIRPNVSVVDADLDKHPLSLSPERTQPDWGSSWEKIWCGRGSIKLLYSQPRTSEGMCAFCGWLIPQKKKE